MTQSPSPLLDFETSLVLLMGVVLACWVLTACAAVGLTARWLRACDDTRARQAVVRTALAGFPGVALLVEIGGRAVQQLITGSSPEMIHFPSCVLAGYWIFVGPALFVSEILARRRLKTVPPGTSIVQLMHFLMWGWSSLFALALGFSQMW